MTKEPGNDEVMTVECLSCNARSEATSMESIGPDGEWRCGSCGGYVAVPVGGDSSTAP